MSLANREQPGKDGACWRSQDQQRNPVPGLEVGVLVFEVEREAIVNVATSIDEASPVAIGINPDIDPKNMPLYLASKKESKLGTENLAERVAEITVMISESG